jgi:cell division septation protein DedD
MLSTVTLVALAVVVLPELSLAVTFTVQFAASIVAARMV